MKRVLCLGLAFLLTFLLIGCAQITNKTSSSAKFPAKDATDRKGDLPKTEGINFEEKLRELSQTPFIVEIWIDGKKEGVWMQSGPKWRFEDPQGKSLAIYQGSEGSFYLIDMEQKTAVELRSGFESYKSFSPLSLSRVYEGYPWEEKTNKLIAETNGVKVEMTFNGPKGLLAEMKITKGNKKQVIRFKYSKVGNIPDELFEVPKGVKVFPLP